MGRRKGAALKNLAGALHTDRVECTLSVSREVKIEIPANYNNTQECDMAETKILGGEAYI
jgi:hypothetical protein